LQQPPAPENNRLLVVDHDAGNRDMLSQRLASRGFAVEAAGNSQEALAKINAAHYDLVLLDHMMPGMTGLDLLRLLRGAYSQNDLPVIMVTSAADQSQVVVQALDEGANDCIVKPIDMPIVAARIQAQLSRAKAGRYSKQSDPLTGLASRSLFLRHLASVLERPRGEGQIAVLLLDLDGFKVLNERLGHHAGDQLLATVGERLRTVAQVSRVRPGMMGRLGGDEFALAIEGVQTQARVESIVTALQAELRRPMSLGQISLSIDGSIGVALGAGPVASAMAGAEELLCEAELAMYRAKEQGKSRWEIYSPNLREAADARMTMAVELRHAIQRNQLFACYQPKIRLDNRAIVGFEALLRWQHPVRGVIPPKDFIPVAEETGLILPIGEWVLGEACRQLELWQKKFPSNPPLSMNVNVSVKQLADPLLTNHVRAILRETAILPETLKLELTESSLITEMESAREVLSSLREMGVGLALDDFGTGYSSLNYLSDLNFDALKIDRSFITRLASDMESHAIVETILNLARRLNMNVVAEGIEDEDQLLKLLRLGCETGQGFLFSRPLTADMAERLLAACPAPAPA